MPPIVKDLSNEPLQSTPDCFARIIRWPVHDTRDFKRSLLDNVPEVKVNLPNQEGKGEGIRHRQALDNGSINAVPITLDVASDIISCVVSKSKGSSSGSFTMILSPGDVNYHHVVHPGDHIFIWMKRKGSPNIKEGAKISDTYANNSADSGLKLYGVITGVRRVFRTSSDGRKILYYQLTGKDIGYFFECDVYYNPNISTIFLDAGFFMQGQLNITGYPIINPGELAYALIQGYMGRGPDDAVIEGLSIPATENTMFTLPLGVNKIFDKGGLPEDVVGITVASLIQKQIYVHQYTTDKPFPDGNDIDSLGGIKFFKLDAGNQYPLWSLLKSYSNPTMNEMYTELRANSKGRLFPTFVLRQIPFTTSRAKQVFSTLPRPIACTAFAELPRMVIPESFIINEDIGRGDHERFNLIELFGTYSGMQDYFTVPMQQLAGNYAADVASVQRHGLRPLIAQTDYHYSKQAAQTNAGATLLENSWLKIEGVGKAIRAAQGATVSLVNQWINLLSDWWLGAHTLETGTFSLVGIEEPLAVGDNIEIVREGGCNELYHVESYEHTYSIGRESGEKSFRTSVNVSRGQRVDEYPIYGSETYTPEDVLDVGISDIEFDSDTRASSSLKEQWGDENGPQSELPSLRKKSNEGEEF